MKSIKQNLALFCCLIILLYSFCGNVYSTNRNDNRVVSIRVEENQSIRDISRKYLNDPDLWVDILRANGIKSPDEVQPGTIIRIPVDLIFQAKHELENSLALIQKANEAGAKIFAPEIIADAIETRNRSN